MFASLPHTATEFMAWSWDRIEPYYQELLDRRLEVNNVTQWLSDWTRLADLLNEVYTQLNVAVTQDTTDKAAEARYNAFLDGIFPAFQSADQKLKVKLLASGLEPEGLEIPLRKMRAEAEIYCTENLPLLTEERKLASAYNKLIGAQTVVWEGEERTLQQMRPVFYTADRSVRERAWRLAAGRQSADRQAINNLWGKLLHLRVRLAHNAGRPDYRSFRWQQMLRLDYTPEDCLQFQQAIEEVVVPAATRVYDRHCRRLGVETVRPWDLDQDLYPLYLPGLPTYGGVAELHRTAETIFYQVDPQLGDYFHLMRSENLLDLENRRGKAPGGYCTYFPVARRPFIFMNAVGLADDVRTMLHEAGHAFHNFERGMLAYAQQRNPGLEFSEVASMAMELLASPYLAAGEGGYFSEADASSFRISHLEHILIFWPYMAVVDAFQHWVYEHPDLASDPASCDMEWMALSQRFIPGVDWSGLEEELMTGWHRKQHIHRYPFYYVEYGVAQLGAVQVWQNALNDRTAAIEHYRQALRLGGTASLPELYQAAGAKFAFDAVTLRAAVEQVEAAIRRELWNT